MQAVQFCLVTSLGACAMPLHQVDSFRTISGLNIGTFKRAGLSLRNRCIDRRPLPVRTATQSTNYRMYRVAVALGIVQPAQRQHANTFPQHGTIGTIRKRSAVARRRQGRCFREAHIHQDIVQCVDTSGQDRIAVSGAKFVQGDAEG